MRMSLKRPLRRTDRVTFRRKSNPVRPASFCRTSGFAACSKELRPAARTRRPPMAGSSHAYGPGSVFSDAPPPESLSCPCRAIHLVPPGKADRTGSAPVPQGHFRACPAGLGTGANAARTFRPAVGASSSLPDAPTFSCSLHGFSQKLSLDQHVCSIYNNRTPVRV